MKRPQPDEYGSFYHGYISAAKDDVLAELREQLADIDFLRSLPKEKSTYAYAAGKWTVNELIGHIIDTERIMSYRLLRFARNDSTALPGFEQDDYIANAHFNAMELGKLIEELELLRKANLFLFNSLTDNELDRRGEASGYPLSVRALLFILAGHWKHHMRVLKERY
jgi:hypothetical protein